MHFLKIFLLEFHAITIVIVCINFARCNSYEEYKVIGTNNGKVRGIHQTTLIEKIDFYEFKGIPYAKPPIGALRFKVSRKSFSQKEIRLYLFVEEVFS